MSLHSIEETFAKRNLVFEKKPDGSLEFQAGVPGGATYAVSLVEEQHDWVRTTVFFPVPAQGLIHKVQGLCDSLTQLMDGSPQVSYRKSERRFEVMACLETQNFWTDMERIMTNCEYVFAPVFARVNETGRWDAQMLDLVVWWPKQQYAGSKTHVN